MKKVEAFFSQIPSEIDLSNPEIMLKVILTVRTVYKFSEDQIMAKPILSLGYWFNKALNVKQRTVEEMTKINMIWTGNIVKKVERKSWWKRILEK